MFAVHCFCFLMMPYFFWLMLKKTDENNIDNIAPISTYSSNRFWWLFPDLENSARFATFVPTFPPLVVAPYPGPPFRRPWHTANLGARRWWSERRLLWQPSACWQRGYLWELRNRASVEWPNQRWVKQQVAKAFSHLSPKHLQVKSQPNVWRQLYNHGWIIEVPVKSHLYWQRVKP